MEILVIIAIFLIFSVGLLARSSSFQNTLALENLAYEVAITIRETQVIAMSVAGIESGGSTVFDAPYGIRLDEGSPNTYIQYADINDSGAYESDNDEVRNEYSVGGSFGIQDVCVIKDSTRDCFATSALSAVDILYERPNSSAMINAVNGSFSVADQVDIVIASEPGATSTVSVYSNGQISVD